MDLGNKLYGINKPIATVIIGAYIILFAFLLPQKFQIDKFIDIPTEADEHIESNKYYIEGVPLINQFPELPTGCEVTSVAMLLNYHGIEVSKEILAEEIQKISLPSYDGYRIEGGSPDEYFIGNPRENTSFGVFNKPIYNLISKYIDVSNITGCEFSQIIEFIKIKEPIMVWITRDLMEVEYSVSWYIDGEEYWWPKGEHTVIITGIEGDTIIVNDPYDGKEKYFKLDRFKEIWETMGRQAILISK